MSLGIYPVFEPKLKNARFEALGEVLAANLEALDRIAHTAKLVPFTSFADNRPIPEDSDGDPDELADILGEWTDWFDPTEGRGAILALANQIKTNPKAAKRLDWPDEVVKELEEMARVLEAAAAEGSRFRLEMT